MNEKIPGSDEIEKQRILGELVAAWRKSLELNAWPSGMTGERDFKHSAPDQIESRENYNRAVQAARKAGITEMEIETALKNSGCRIIL